ncbi:EGF-like and EMI domain-containing protein 1 isoform c precursor [Mus musculus]|uniref:EGF-like and EMI domain-containing protein 1 isoform c precursor n=1 Tax=Mus musculus TaxID=10090 RepID=UPI0007EDF101|nr:EGF-like and EMI domain-containing protein 1 isoform c precursor [Mus musculus]|eukprot:XP_017175275.1 PREDICTED: EGF-like and EMI domain-containing protein 1 isoform X7 [Mus musculus]
MTSPLCFWCFCVWAAANWPPGSALQLQPGMPNVCREEQLTLVRLSRPCAQAFIDTIQFWKQGCSGPRWCVGYERRIRYYIIYRHVYATEHQTVFRCCPGWIQWDDEPGCFSSLSSLGTHFSGRECSYQDTRQCLCSQGFHGPHCQYDINECAVDNGGCRDRCCNTIGSYYCRCQAGQKLEEDGRGCEDVDECAVVNGGCQQRCINTLGTFHCECDTGYRRHADERTCIKTDPCAGANGCAHLCQTENGMARCACHAGYQLSEDKKACEDINECAEELAPCAHHCVNSKGSFTCTCHPGFELGADRKHCYRIELEIVNICEKNNGGCSHHCEPAIGGAHCSCNHGHQLDTDGKTCIALDEQLEEEEEEIDILRFPGRLAQNPPQPFPYLDPSLTASYEDEDNDDADSEAEGEVQGLTALYRVVCLDGTFGLDCSLSCEDCMNGGRCQEGKSGCLCPAEWTGLICNESSVLRTGEDQQAPAGCLKGFFGKNCKRKCHCANNVHCHRVYGACMCDLGRYGRFCHLSCPRGAYGASCSLECQCVEENTLECSAKNGSCTCKSGYQGNRCQEELPLPA